MRPNKYTKFVFVYFVLGDFMVPKTFAEKPSPSKKLFTSYGGGFKENVTKQKKKRKIMFIFNTAIYTPRFASKFIKYIFPVCAAIQYLINNNISK